MFPWQPVWPMTAAVRVTVAFNEVFQAFPFTLCPMMVRHLGWGGPASAPQWRRVSNCLGLSTRISGVLPLFRRRLPDVWDPALISHLVWGSHSLWRWSCVLDYICTQINWGHKWVSVINLSEILLGGGIGGEELGGNLASKQFIETFVIGFGEIQWSVWKDSYLYVYYGCEAR